MAFDYTCPLPTALATINRGCTENLGEIRHLAIGRKGLVFFDSGAGTPDPITAKAGWTTRIGATDDTKIVVIPNVRNFITNDPTFTKTGEDDSLGGVGEIIGVPNALFTGKIRSVKGSVMKNVQALIGESLEVFFINEYGKIIGKDVSSALDGSVVGGFPILDNTFGVTWAKAGGKLSLDDAMLELAMEDTFWRNDLVISTPAAGFNPLIDLLPAYES